jgi:hypothetical protein
MWLCASFFDKHGIGNSSFGAKHWKLDGWIPASSHKRPICIPPLIMQNIYLLGSGGGCESHVFEF